MIKEGCVISPTCSDDGVTSPTCSDDGVTPPTCCEGDVHLMVLSQHGLECPYINRVTRPHHMLHHYPGVREGVFTNKEDSIHCTSMVLLENK